LVNRVANSAPALQSAELARFIAKLLLPKLTTTIVCPTIHGYELSVSPTTGINYYYMGTYEPGTLHVMDQCLRPGDVFIDAGASVGQMSLHAASLVGSKGRVLAFEPETRRYDDLVRSIDLNNAQNVESFKQALGDQNDQLQLQTNAVSPTLRGYDSGSSELVNVEPLDDCLARLSINQVRMIKIDVEGFEGRVIKGGERLFRSDAAPIVCFEHGVYDDEYASVFQLLSEFNDYEYFRLSKTKRYVSNLTGFDVNQKLWRHDNIFAILPSHISTLPEALFA